MAERINNKFHSKKGVTIIMAMLVILVAVTVSSVVLIAANTSAKHLASDREAQQAYLTTGSAAELVRDALADKTYVVTTTTVTNSSGETTNTSKTKATGTLSTLINYGMKKLLQGNEYTTTFTVSATDIDEVIAKFTMDKNGNITIVFSEKDSSAYSMKLTLACEKNKVTKVTSSGTGESKKSTEVVTTTYTWQARDITKN